MSGRRKPQKTCTYTCMYEIDLFCGIQNFFYLAAVGLFSRSQLRGTQGARQYTTVNVWVSAELRRACSGRSKSRNLASNHGIGFRPARANQAHANPKNVGGYFLHFFTSLLLSLCLRIHQLPKARQPRDNCRASSFSVCDSHERCFCVWVRECACVCVWYFKILQQ